MQITFYNFTYKIYNVTYNVTYKKQITFVIVIQHRITLVFYLSPCEDLYHESGNVRKNSRTKRNLHTVTPPSCYMDFTISVFYHYINKTTEN